MGNKPIPVELRALVMAALDDIMQGNDRNALDQLWQLDSATLNGLEPACRRMIDLCRVAQSVRAVENEQR